MPAVVPARLRLARELRGWSQAHLASRAGMTPAALSQFESGTSRAAQATLERLSNELGVPSAFFDLAIEEVPEGFFRSTRRTPVVDRRRARAVAQIAHDVATLGEDEVNSAQTSVPKYLLGSPQTVQMDIERAASLVREEWGTPPGPIANVVDLLEANGVVVIRMPLDSADIDAFSLAFTDRPVIVLASDKADKARSRFDVSHELGHLVLHGADIWGTSEVEKQAHHFASAFLMPRDQIYEELPDRVDWPKLFDLKRLWQVSLAALLMRARTLDRISEAAYLTAVKTASARGWRRVEPVPLGPPEQPHVLARVLGSNFRPMLDRVLPKWVLDSLMFSTSIAQVPRSGVRRFDQGVFAFDDF